MKCKEYVVRGTADGKDFELSFTGTCGTAIDKRMMEGYINNRFAGQELEYTMFVKVSKVEPLIKLGEITHLLNEYDDFKVSVNREEIDNFLSVEELVANYSNYYLEYISFGAEDYEDIIFMCIDLFDEDHKEDYIHEVQI
ncbi:hypothetical protein EH802P2_00112 [Enterococcus phage EH802P2]|nr:hypothetical protein EH802P1_00104 [Enterococcus phage EH802P1]WAX16217.1 hypothetical protein EH802P2_00112 [Enterococcus phage EH802P2]